MDHLCLGFKKSLGNATSAAAASSIFRGFHRNNVLSSNYIQWRHLSSQKPVQHITIQKKSAEKKKSGHFFNYVLVGLSSSLVTAVVCDAMIRRQVDEELCEWESDWDHSWRSESQKRDTAFRLSHPVRRQQQRSQSPSASKSGAGKSQHNSAAQTQQVTPAAPRVGSAPAERKVQSPAQKQSSPIAVVPQQAGGKAVQKSKVENTAPASPKAGANALKKPSPAAAPKQKAEAKRSTLAAPPPTDDAPQQGTNAAKASKTSAAAGNQKVQDNAVSSSPAVSSNNDTDKVVKKEQRCSRQILLIRHGQYKNIRSTSDAVQGLTPLGCTQAHSTGKRLAQILKDKNCVAIRHSTMLRAKQTADIIGQYLPGVPMDADSSLEEGVPCLPSPLSPSFKPLEEEIAKDSPRIETAFRRYFYRPPVGEVAENNGAQYEVIVCHGNVIRYFFCRSLQLPPTAWLRLATFNCGITWLSVTSDGYVSGREFGNVGHLPSNHITYH